MRTKSSLACKAALRHPANAKNDSDFADVMWQDYRIATRMILQHDFAECETAAIVDKTNDTAWNPASPQGGCSSRC